MMQGAYGGLIVILMYAGLEVAPEEDFELITQDNLFIFTQTSNGILVQE